MQFTAEIVNWDVAQEEARQGTLEEVFCEGDDLEFLEEGEERHALWAAPAGWEWGSDSAQYFTAATNLLQKITPQLSGETLTAITELIDKGFDESMDFPPLFDANLDIEVVFSTISPEGVDLYLQEFKRIDYDLLRSAFQSLPNEDLIEEGLDEDDDDQGFIDYIKQWQSLFEAAAQVRAAVFLSYN